MEDRSDSRGFLGGTDCSGGSVSEMFGVRRVAGEGRDFRGPSRDFCELRDRFMICIPLLRGEGLDVEVAGL